MKWGESNLVSALYTVLCWHLDFQPFDQHTPGQRSCCCHNVKLAMQCYAQQDVVQLAINSFCQLALKACCSGHIRHVLARTWLIMSWKALIIIVVIIIVVVVVVNITIIIYLLLSLLLLLLPLSSLLLLSLSHISHCLPCWSQSLPPHDAQLHSSPWALRRRCHSCWPTLIACAWSPL